MAELAATSNKIIIEPLPDEEREDGLILPANARRDDYNGVVIARGPEVDERIQVGTKVNYNDKSGATIETNVRKLRVMRDIDLHYFYHEQPEPVSA